MYRAESYGVDPSTGLIDYDALRALAKKVRPKLLVAGFSAYSRVLDWALLRSIADDVGASLMADIAHVAGLVAVGLYPSPLPYAEVVTSTTHKTLRGPRAGMIMARGDATLEKKLNAAVFPGLQGGPLLHSIAAKAVAFREALLPAFKSYQEQVLRNAKAMVKVLKDRGLTVVSGGTDNHLFLLSFYWPRTLWQRGRTGFGASQYYGE